MGKPKETRVFSSRSRWENPKKQGFSHREADGKTQRNKGFLIAKPMGKPKETRVFSSRSRWVPPFGRSASPRDGGSGAYLKGVVGPARAFDWDRPRGDRKKMVLLRAAVT